MKSTSPAATQAPPPLPADEAALEFIRRIDLATTMALNSSGHADAADEWVDFRTARSKVRHAQALRRSLRQAHEVLVGWEEQVRAVGLGAALAPGGPAPLPDAESDDQPDDQDEPGVDARIRAARAALAAYDRTARPADPENVTNLITGLLHLLAADDHPADVVAAAIEMWAHDRHVQILNTDPWPTTTVSDLFIGLASLLVSHLMYGADRLRSGGAMALLHLATGDA